MTIGIIGGGIAGLASAIALAKIGKEVDLYEKTPKFAPVGAGLQIGPNAVSALKQLGVFDRLEPLTVKPQNIRIWDGLSGELLNTLPLGSRFEEQFGQPYRVSHRADLLSALIQTANDHPEINIHLGHSLNRLELTPTNTICHFANTNMSSHELLIGADGFRSVVRRTVLNDGPPIFAGHSLFRALIDMNDAPDNPHISDVNLWMYPNGHVVHYPVSAGKSLNIVAASEQDWENKGWSTPATPTEVESYFTNASIDLQAIIKSPKKWLKWAAAGHPPTNIWYKNKALLIGDAIHPTLPYLAQGAAMALEDSVCLAEALKPAKGGLAEFVAIRQKRTQKIVSTSRQLGKIYHMTTPKRWVRNFAIARTSKKSQYNRLSWLYKWSAPEL